MIGSALTLGAKDPWPPENLPKKIKIIINNVSVHVSVHIELNN